MKKILLALAAALAVASSVRGQAPPVPEPRLLGVPAPRPRIPIEAMQAAFDTLFARSGARDEEGICLHLSVPGWTPVRVLAALSSPVPLHDAERCGGDSVAQTTPDGRHAMHMELSATSVADGAWSVEIGYQEMPMWGTGWRCRVTPSGATWTATACTIVWQS